MSEDRSVRDLTARTWIGRAEDGGVLPRDLRRDRLFFNHWAVPGMKETDEVVTSACTPAAFEAALALTFARASARVGLRADPRTRRPGSRASEGEVVSTVELDRLPIGHDAE